MELKHVNGMILVNKPKGLTSFDVVRQIKKDLKLKKVGHLGTLDPNATGLLPLCIGKATRLSRFLIKSDKTYIATIRLGRETDTYDVEGEFLGDPKPVPPLTDDDINRYLQAFTGEITQIPPIYSAKKIDGKRLYDYAREGIEIEPKPCSVTIYSIDVVSIENDKLVIKVSCSAGTYVRSLAHDLGQMIGCGAFLEDLVRSRVGELLLEDAYSLEVIKDMFQQEDYSFIRSAADMLPELNRINANQAQALRIRNGNHIVTVNPLLKDNEQIIIVDDNGQMLAIALVKKPFGSTQIQLHPKVVIG